MILIYYHQKIQCNSMQNIYRGNILCTTGYHMKPLNQVKLKVFSLTFTPLEGLHWWQSSNDCFTWQRPTHKKKAWAQKINEEEILKVGGSGGVTSLTVEMTLAISRRWWRFQEALLSPVCKVIKRLDTMTAEQQQNQCDHSGITSM